MDCEKFEPLLLDELYEELDEVTSAAVKRHVSGCARCASLLNGMKATRRSLPMLDVPVPAGLEDRILAAAKEASKVVPIKSRFSRVVVVAGSWAMRPQTAMAAVFLLMIGTSAFLIRSKDYRSKDSAVSVTVAGSPAPVTAVAQNDSLDDNAAASAHGPSSPIYTRPPMPAGSVATGDNGPIDRLTNGAAREDDQNQAVGTLGARDEKSKDKAGYDPSPPPPVAIANAAAPAGAPMPSPTMSPGDSMTQQPMARAGGKTNDPYSLGAAAFQARNYAEATRQFDAAAKTGDRNAELWAAESTREGQGCAVALGRFDSLSQKATGSWVGSEASLRAAKCQIAMGQTDAAKTRLLALQQQPSHQQAAQQAMNDLNQAVAAKGAGGGTGVHANAAPRKSSMPARPAAAAPARAPAQESEQKKAVDSAY